MAAITAAEAGSQNIVRFLDLIAHSEGTSSHPLTQHDGYDVIVSSVHGPAIFDDFSDHPFAHGRAPQLVRREPELLSTASGRYQLLLRFWRDYRVSLALTDFSPISQDHIAIQQIREKHAIEEIMFGQIETAISLCSKIWASLPGNQYGQGGKSMEELLDWWSEHQTV